MFLKKLLRFHRPKRTLYSKKYGVAQIQYTHATNTVIHTSTKIDGKLKACFLNHLSLIQMQNFPLQYVSRRPGSEVELFMSRT